jgi:hypothetical protein
LEKSKNKILYDENAKKFLSQKIILAHILVATVEEFKGMKPEDAMQYIESHPAVSTERVDPEGTEIKDFFEDDKSTMITGMNTEDLSEIDETIFYDIKFYAYAPSTKERIKLIIGIEAQNKFNPGYDIVTRSVYYGARMLSSQKGTEFVKSDYDKIKKVYSIWILTRCPLDIRNTITEFSIEQNNIVENAVFNNRYDLLNIIFVGLSAEVVNESDEHRLHRLLETFFSSD